MGVILKKTSKSDQKIALNSIEYFEKSGKSEKGKYVELRIEDSSEAVKIPLKAFTLLKSILSNMSEGKSIALILADSEISTQEAADILNVSRPHVVKLLESGKIPFKKVGTHRRIQLDELLQYENKLSQKRRENLDELASNAQELNLGYE